MRCPLLRLLAEEVEAYGSVRKGSRRLNICCCRRKLCIDLVDAEHWSLISRIIHSSESQRKGKAYSLQQASSINPLCFGMAIERHPPRIIQRRISESSGFLSSSPRQAYFSLKLHGNLFSRQPSRSQLLERRNSGIPVRRLGL